jgi:hypothetical protein
MNQSSESAQQKLDKNLVLSDLRLDSRANQTWQYSGFDSPEYALDPLEFDMYLWAVQYCYNSRGFRGPEWPDNLEQAIWCVGDSFTLGMGAPIEHSWPSLLQSITGRNCINISMDGASNQWISRRAQQIYLEIKPQWICVQWSFIHRRESQDSSQPDEDRRIWNTFSSVDEDRQSFIESVQALESLCGSNVVHSTIPLFSNNQIIREMQLAQIVKNNIPYFDRMDTSRDGFHYDKITAQWVAEQIAKFIN